MENTKDKAILTGITGGLSLFSLLLLVIGAGMLGFQIVMLSGGKLEEMQMAVRFLPGSLGLVFMIMFFLKAFRKGNITVYPDRISGKALRGGAYDIALADVAEVDLRSSNILLKDSEGKIMLLERPPRPREIPGLIWLLHEWQDQVPADFAKHWFGTEKGAKLYRRAFLNEAAEPAFLDAGHIIKFNSRSWYFPATDTVYPPRPTDDKASLSTTLRAGGMILKFDPDPSRLPLDHFIRAMIASGGDNGDMESALEKMAEDHGGCLIEAEGSDWKGECAGYPISLSPLGKG